MTSHGVLPDAVGWGGMQPNPSAQGLGLEQPDSVTLRRLTLDVTTGNIECNHRKHLTYLLAVRRRSCQVGGNGVHQEAG
ncbi:MAG: hypothetical protein ACM3ZE_01070 [Myxococcales bacterium]